MVPTDGGLLPSPERGDRQFRVLGRQHYTNLRIRFVPPR